MKKLLLIFTLVIGGMTVTNAQEVTTENERDYSGIIENRVESLTEQLSLTDQQVAQVQAIYEKTLGAEGNSAESADQRHTEIMALLNADQKEIYSDYLENRSTRTRGVTSDSEERPQMDVASIIDGRLEDLTERLSLTNSQATQVRAIYEKTLGVQTEDESGVSSSDQRHNEIMELLNADQKEIYSTYLEERSQRFQNREN